MTDNKNKEDGKKKLLTAVLVILLIAAVGVIIYLVTHKETPEPEKPSSGVVGVISDSWDPNAPQPEGGQQPGTQIPGYSSAVMKAGDTSLKISIGNPESNKVGFYATLKLEDGTELYTSPLLKPGQGLEEVPLKQTLDKGEYSAMVEYQCVSLEDESVKLNTAQSGFVLKVE